MIAHNVKVILGVVLAISLAMATPSFASPNISDADISFSVKGYYSQFLQSTTYTQYVYVSSNGTLTSDSTISMHTTDYVSVYGGGTVMFFYNTSRQAYVRSCFYDSSYQVIDGGYNGDLARPNATGRYFAYVPSGAVYARFTIVRPYSSSAMAAACKFVSTDMYLDDSNYQYVWSEIQGLTLDSDGNLFIPYQVYGFTQIYLDFRFFDSVYQFSNIAFKVLSEYSDSSVYSGLLDYGDGQVLAEPYILNGDSIQTTAVASSSSNPARFAFNIPHSEFSGFLIYLPVNIPNGNVSTAVKVNVYDFQLDGEDVSARLEVDRVLGQLDNLVEQLTLPSPDLDTLLDVGGVLNNTNDTNASGIMSVIASDGGIITTMMVISVSVTVLGYILFGKKEA